MISTLASGIISVSGTVKGTLSELSNTSTSPLLGAVNTFLGALPHDDSTSSPEAYLNWIIFEEHFNFNGAGALAAGPAKTLATLANTGINITKNGYIYIYVSNKTQNWDVFFDNLVVNHSTGPLQEENHYYPFGLTMAGISSKALNFGAPENKYKFHGGTELSTSLDVNLYETDPRLYDPQIGRFLQVDELADQFNEWSPYTFSVDNPVLVNDPTELDTLTRKTNLDPAYVTAIRESKGDVYSNRLALGAQMGINGPVIYENDRPSLQEYLRAMNRYDDRRNAFNTAEAKFTVEVAAWLVPWGRIIKGPGWLYKIGKAEQEATGTCIASAVGPTNNSIATSGPWQLNNKTSFTAILTAMTNSSTPTIQAITAIYDSTAGTLTGQYTYTQGSGVPGTFKLTRVPD